MESILNFLSVPLGYILRFCYSIIPNYVVVIMLFALLIKLILFPLGIKQQKNMVKQASLRPKENAIRKKYAGRTDKATQQKMNEEVMELYQRENFNPMGGCLPMLIQFPILISLYYVIRGPLTYICRLSKESVESIKNVLIEKGIEITQATSEIDYITAIRENNLFDSVKQFFADTPFNTVESLPKFSIGPIDLSGTPSFELNWLLLVPILTFVFLFLSMRISRKLTYQPEQTQQNGCAMKSMDYFMPLISVWITFSVPAIVGVYWIAQNLFGTLQQYVLKLMYPYPTFTEEEMKAAEREINGSSKKAKKTGNLDPNRPKPRSLHHIDDDDYNQPSITSANGSGSSEKPQGFVEKEKPEGGSEMIGKARLKDDKRDEH